MEGKSAAPSVPSYKDFEPYCQWQREEGRDVLAIQLPEFKKEQLRVQINNRGILKISGERSIDSWKKSRFYKEVEVPKNCDISGIQAKFANGCLYVIMPKTPKSPTEQTKTPEIDASGADQKKPQATQPPLVEKPSSAEEKENLGSSKEEMQPSPSVAHAPADGKKLPKDATKPKRPVSGMKRCAKTSLNVAVAVAVLGALVSYVLYMYRSTVLED